MLQKITLGPQCWAWFSFPFLLLSSCGATAWFTAGKLTCLLSSLYFDILGDLIAFGDVLRLIRLEQQCCPAVLSSAFWKVVGRGCLLSGYHVYVIHYLSTPFSATYQSCSSLEGITIMCAFNLSIQTSLYGCGIISVLRILPYFSFWFFSDLFSGMLLFCAVDTQ